MKRKITLASTSPRRNGLLQQIGLEFSVVESDYQEDMGLRMSPKKLVMHFAQGKAEHAAQHLVLGGLVIGVDTIAVCRGRKLGKPATKENAEKMLRFVSGRTIKVYSGVCIVDVEEKTKVVDCEVSKVKMKKLTDEEIKAYVATGEPLDKAGGHAIQGLGAIFVEKIKGCYSNIEGLPLHKIYKMLKARSTNIFEYEKWQGQESKDQSNTKEQSDAKE